MTDSANAKVTDIKDAVAKKRGGGPKRGDSWDTTDSGYDEDRFYTASTSSDEKSEKVYLRIDSGVWARMLGIVNKSDVTNYRTPHDLMRDAVIHRMHYLSKRGKVQDPDLDRWLKLQVRQGEVVRRRQMMKACKEALAEFQEAFGEAETARDWNEAGALIEQAEEAVEELDEPYAGDLMRMLDDFKRKVPSPDGVKIRR